MSFNGQRKRILGAHFGTRNRGRYTSHIDGGISHSGKRGNVLPIQQDNHTPNGDANDDERYAHGFEARNH